MEIYSKTYKLKPIIATNNRGGRYVPELKRFVETEETACSQDDIMKCVSPMKDFVTESLAVRVYNDEDAISLVFLRNGRVLVNSLHQDGDQIMAPMNIRIKFKCNLKTGRSYLIKWINKRVTSLHEVTRGLSVVDPYVSSDPWPFCTAQDLRDINRNRHELRIAEVPQDEDSWLNYSSLASNKCLYGDIVPFYAIEVFANTLVRRVKERFHFEVDAGYIEGVLCELKKAFEEEAEYVERVDERRAYGIVPFGYNLRPDDDRVHAPRKAREVASGLLSALARFNRAPNATADQIQKYKDGLISFTGVSPSSGSPLKDMLIRMKAPTGKLMMKHPECAYAVKILMRNGMRTDLAVKVAEHMRFDLTERGRMTSDAKRRLKMRIDEFLRFIKLQKEAYGVREKDILRQIVNSYDKRQRYVERVGADYYWEEKSAAIDSIRLFWTMAHMMNTGCNLSIGVRDFVQYHEYLVQLSVDEKENIKRAIDLRRFEYTDKDKDLEDTFTIDGTAYSFLLPESIAHLKEIGKKMHNCVGGYWKDVDGGGTRIIYMNEEEVMKTCIELDVNKKSYTIVQAKIVCNGQPEPKTASIIREWARRKGVDVKTRDLPESIMEFEQHYFAL
ncbi:MAG: PcfJ domain-containing protein [Candidatus Bathyarchaeota archaeon]|nr:PcfJ domain-containing protein [Candidatus Bathyarchaeota archaeon]